MAPEPYRDAALGVDARVEDLLGRMTHEEKLAQLVGIWIALDAASGQVAPYQGQFVDEADQRPIEERIQHGIGQLTRPFGSRPVAPADGVRLVNELQRRLVEDTRLGIPAMVHEECLSGFMAWGATAFPCPLNSGSTWDPDLIRRMGAAIGAQMRAVGAHQGLAPVMDVVRDARWGRVEECLGEDPYLVAQLGAAYVAGVESAGVAATLKHFAGYSSSEGGRNLAPAHVGPRELRDVFLPPFETAIREGGARSVMNAYQDIDGVPVAASAEMLTSILRDDIGFEGIVVADYFSVPFLHLLHGVSDGREHSAALALHAGIDVELPNPDCYPVAAPSDDVDRAVRRVLRLKFELGLFEGPYVDADGPIDLDPPEHRELAREVAAKSIVLLKNEGGLLPLPDGSKVALIGPNADSAAALLGNYTFQNHVGHQFPDAEPGPPVATIRAALEATYGSSLRFARGCDVVDDDRAGFAEAVEVARAADVAIVVLGDQAGNFGRGTSGEGTDTDDLSLPGVQADLAAAVIATGTPTVVVLVIGRPYAIAPIAERAAAIVCAWFPGEEGGGAIADVLTGVVSPGGRTPLTFGRGAGQQPLTHDHRRLSRGGYARSTSRPVFPFGHGLSYTSFEYSDLEIAPRQMATDGVVSVACTVANTGPRAGDEVVQLYTSDSVASVTRPVQELKGFSRVALAPGERRRVTFRLPSDLLSFTGVDLQRVVEPGLIRILVGASSADIRLRGEVEITGDTPRVVVARRALTTRVDLT